MGGKRKLTYEEVKKRFEDNGFSLLEKEYVNNSTPMLCVCKCGNKIYKALGNVRTGCVACGKKKMAKSQRLSFDFVKTEFEKGGCVLLSETYKNAQSPLKYKCSCGTISQINYSNFRVGKRCNNCRYRKIGDKKRRPYEEVKSYFEKQGCQLLSKTYKNGYTPLDYVCVCGRKNKIRFDNFKNGARCWDCFRERNSGENNVLYKPELTKEHRENGRNFKELRDWRKAVFERDQYTCTKCGKRGGHLNAHHLLGYDSFPDWREVLHNGVTLCRECHKTFHRTYGYGGNYFSQFLEWNIEWHYRSVPREAAASQFDF